MNEERAKKLNEEVRAQGLDGIALVPGPNLTYVSGIHTHLSERPIVLFLPVDDEPAIIIPVLEASKAEDAGISLKRIFVWSDEDGYAGAFERASSGLGLSDFRLGVEALRMRVLEMEMLHRYAPRLATSPADPIMDALRLRKDADELAAMERAVAAAEAAMHSMLPQIKPGLTEKEVAAMLTAEILGAGADALAFNPIVSAGPNSASPHATPTNRRLRDGDPLVIDWGASVDGYVSDITRTFGVGHLDEEFRLIYDVVKAANAAGVAAAEPGASGEAIDRAARSVIENAGYDDYFIHRTGHGLGMEAHESPSLVAGNTDPLPEGAVFTVEPGIYLPKQGGVRIEDDVVITADGRRSLTTFPRELTFIGQ